MKKILIAALLVMFIAVPLQAAAPTDTLQVDYVFDQSPLPDKLRLYVGDAQICETAATIDTFTCSVTSLPYGDNVITMTAVSGDKESPKSPEYIFTKDINAPTITNIKVTTTVTITTQQ